MPNYDGEMASFKDSTKNKIYEIVDKDARDRLDNLSSSDVAYDNTQTSLQADTVQEAIDEIVNTGAAIASAVTYDNTTSGLSASNVQDALDEVTSEKVDKEAGKGLSTEDYTSSEKNKLSGIENGAEKNNVWFGKVRKATDYNSDLGFVIDTEVAERNEFRNGDILFLWFNDIDWSQLQLQNNYLTYLYFNQDPDTTTTPSSLRPYLVNRIIPNTSSQYIYATTALGNNNRWFAPRSLMTFVFRMDGGTEIGFVIQREMASTDHYGEVILSNGTGSNAEDMAATPKAVKTVKDLIPQDASELAYDNTSSGLLATNVQDAIDEFKPKTVADNIDYWATVLDAQTHDPLATYNRGDVVRDNNKLYVAIVDGARGAITSNEWQEVTAEDVASLVTQVADKLNVLNPVATGYAYVYGNLSSQYDSATFRVDRESDDSNNAYIQCRRRDGKYTIYLASYSSGIRSIVTNDGTTTYKNVIAIDSSNNATSDFIASDWFDYYNTELPTLSSSSSSTTWTEFRRFAITKGYWVITVAILYPKKAGGGRSVGIVFNSSDSESTTSPGGSTSQTVGSSGADVETNVVLTTVVKADYNGYIHIMGRQNSGSTISGTHYVRARGIKLMGI